MTLPTLLLALASTAHAQTVIEVPGDQPTIQLAVNAAGTNDIVEIDQIGIVESFTVNGKTITIRGGVSLGGWVGTMTTGGGANVTLEDLVIRGGFESTDPAEIEEGIYCSTYVVQTPGVQATNSTVIANNSEFVCFNAPAIDALNANVTVDQSEFRYNQNIAGGYGGGLYAEGSGDVLVQNSDFEINRAGTFGGGLFSTAATTRLINNRFYANNAIFGGGGGAWVSSPVMEIHSNSFENNFSLQWWIPGIVIDDPEDLVAFGGDIAGLTVGVGDGAGLYVEDPPAGGTLDVWNNLFCGNLGDTGSGVYINDVPSSNVQNNVFAENWALHYGGGIHVTTNDDWSATGDEASIVNNHFLINRAGRIPPPYPNLTVVLGGGGAVGLEGTLVDFRNNIVSQSEFGGGMMGVNGADYEIGDLIEMEYNIFYWNCSGDTCTEGDPLSWSHFTGDLAQYSLSPTNLELDPLPLYFGDGEFNCFPDAFYPSWDSPAVRNGDPAEPNIYSPLFSDIGAFGGPRADVADRDGDGFENIYDCNDDPDAGGSGVFPGAPEICDGLDNNCNGDIDEGFDTTWYIDNDGDGFGDVNQVQPTITCSPPANSVLNRDDCDDADATVNPNSPEICDGLDNDCDDIADGGLSFRPVWDDLDEDLYGDTFKEQMNGCQAEDGNSGYYVLQEDQSLVLMLRVVDNNSDCNDANPNVNPTAIEVCDQVDNDCDGEIDNSQTDGTLWFNDGDQDGFGAGQGEYACSPPNETAIDNGGDCDDFDPAVNPGATERCDGIDNDCDGLLDKNASDAPQLYEDLDNDGLGNPATAVRDCNPGPSYTTAVGGDCDDNDPTVGECTECGCQAAPTPASTGGLLGVLGVLMMLRRRRD